jgi:phospholipase/lecithinase/hemolysin
VEQTFSSQLCSAANDLPFLQLTDIYNNPSQYLNGSAPLDVTGYANNVNGSNNTSPDSFMWYDELHPSEQTDRVIAREFVNVVKGGSKWAAYWSS